MNSWATMLHIAGPALLGMGALFATIALSVVLFSRSRSSAEATTPPPTGTLRNLDFRARPLLSRREMDWYILLRAVVEAAGEQFDISFQVPLDRVVEPDASISPGGLRLLRKTRVDFLVMDQEGRPVMAACLGAARAQATEALEKAGVPVLDILPDDADEDIAADAYALLLSADVATIPAKAPVSQVATAS